MPSSRLNNVSLLLSGIAILATLYLAMVSAQGALA